MSKSNKILPLFFCSIFLLSLTSCLESLDIENPDFPVINSVELLIYLENNGDVINSSEAPFIIEAEEVYNNLGVYLLLDIRSQELYSLGHIEGSINLHNNELYDYLETTNVEIYPKIIIITQTGQAAAYFTSLLRLSGITNAYCMNYGMASWNPAFANPWLSALHLYDSLDEFVNTDYPKPRGGNYPDIHVPDNCENAYELLKYRVARLLNEGFIDVIHHDSESVNSIMFEDAYRDIYNPNVSFTICYGDANLYFYGKSYIDNLDGHPLNTILYKALFPFNELRSDRYLHTLPVDKTIFIYSYNGHYSAAATAYLRLLGYDAKSILFGMNNIEYRRMTGNGNPLTKWMFSEYSINNFPYVKN